MTKTKPVSVSVLTGAIKKLLEDEFSSIRVEGEISNFKQHSSGHKYFTLKDENASISCVMWRSSRLNFLPKDGMRVIATGSISVYPPRGNYQILVQSMQPLGEGDLWLAYEQLKKKLESQGYFAVERKRPLPVLPIKIGVSTSPTGAAVKDIFSSIERRFPAAEILFRPTQVQGAGSETDISKAIAELNSHNPDLIIIGRGGGSIEDLWCYNTIETAEAIFNSKAPIISAVGHETDFTIADFVADFRAATPTAAAEMATPNTAEHLMNFLNDSKKSLSGNISKIIENYKEKIEDWSGRKLHRRLNESILFYQQRLDEFDLRLKSGIGKASRKRRDKFESLMAHLNSLYPLSPLERGFAALKHDGNYIPKYVSVKDFDKIELIRNNETVEIIVNS